MKDNKSSARGVTLLHTMTNKQCTSLHWSPSGRFLLLAGLGVRGACCCCCCCRCMPRLLLLLLPLPPPCTCLRLPPPPLLLPLHIAPLRETGLKCGLSTCCNPDPQGGHNGVVEFWDCEEMTLLSAGEHFMAQEVAWDPTGRYVATIVNAGEPPGRMSGLFGGTLPGGELLIFN